MPKRALVIGAGFGGLSAAAYLAKAGYNVTVFEKNDQPGGRAMVLRRKGFTFDLGPSWYMMPDVFEEFFANFGKHPSDYYKLVQLLPSYRVFTRREQHDVYPAPKAQELFESLEPGSGVRLQELLNITGDDYQKVRSGLLDLDGTQLRQTLNPDVLRILGRRSSRQSYHRRIGQYAHTPELQHILEFMTVFMGGSPHNIPAIYALLNYVDMGLGIWYPMGGFGRVVDAFVKVAAEQGVSFVYNAPVSRIITEKGKVVGVKAGDKLYTADLVVANADYHHVETELLQPNNRSYSAEYWTKRTLSPSGLLAYIGLNKKVPGLRHHNLLFDVNWDRHFREVFDQKLWSPRPLVYVSCPSKTDHTVAPKGQENIFILAPMANGLHPRQQTMEQTVDAILTRLEKLTSASIKNNVVFRDVRGHRYFEQTFNAYQGNAFGLAHTLRQSGPLRARMKSKKLSNLYYVGQYTNPGTGVPMVVTSGKVVARLIAKEQSGA